MNQIKGVFKGQIEIQSQICLTPDEKDKIQDIHLANFFMAIESYFDEQIDFSYSTHKTLIYELMCLEIIPHTNIFERPNGVHTLKFLILSDTGCTNTTFSDRLFKCFTPSMIGSRNIVVNNYAGKTGAGVNQYRFNFLTDQGRKPIMTESVEKENFSETRYWTQQELNRIFHINRIPLGTGIS